MVKDKKEFTEQDLRDAFNWGMTFHQRKIMNNIRKNILKINEQMIDGKDSIDIAIENMLKDKRGIPRV